MWLHILLGFSTALLVTGGLCAWPQPGRTYPNTAAWQAILVLLAGAGWAIGAVPAVMAARRSGWWIAAVYLALAGASFAAMWNWTDRRAATFAAGVAAPLAVAGWLIRVR